MAKIVVALGGNALGNNPFEQKKCISQAARVIVSFIKAGHQVMISHGNGPQVGMIQLAFEKLLDIEDSDAPMDLSDYTAMSQGYIGFHLQLEIKRELLKQALPIETGTIITQVVVDKEDLAFENPTKPIGKHYDKEEALKIMNEHPNEVFVEDAGRGWRKVVPSPKPMEIVEIHSIEEIVNRGHVVISCGGGGIPVVEGENGDYQPISAVIDKDLASAILAKQINADYLFVLTAVDRVALNFGKPNQKELSELTVNQAKKYCKEGHFASGSMLPKVEAAIEFVESGIDRKAFICSLEKAMQAMDGLTGTQIINGTY
ncbi:carbamate kinase [Virgibacillus dokdonensis]|uniref:Carbamate kinase n=1 Tax=Virgibacillus dokdonensis TaxID=302167 RepID=A0A3E0WMU5_9BACI|nr:carbamate kinase [Virgibacillus dokdonensis]RFA33523.1 carbamate kinase [Virgibacillus dokdonensis]